MIILGINAYHGDASACIFIDNELVAAAEEERFTRIKHSAGFPYNAIKFCLDFCKVKLSDVNHIAINRNPKQKIISKLIYASKNIFNIKFFSNRVSNLKKINSLKEELENHFNESCNADLHQIDHHTSHVASSIYFSSYKNTNFISVDGFGDFTSTVVGFFDGEKINKYEEVLFPHSLGLFYTAITQYLGFLKYGDEYKVMGLAPYGEPIYFNKIKDVLITNKNNLFNLNLKYFNHHTGNVEMTWLNGEPKIGKVYSQELINLLGPERNPKDKIEKVHKDIAASVQKIYEESEKVKGAKKLPLTLEQSLSHLSKSNVLQNAFGKDVINSYVRLKNREIKKYNSSIEKKIGFKGSKKTNKSGIITQWEKDNTLDC